MVFSYDSAEGIAPRADRATKAGALESQYFDTEAILHNHAAGGRAQVCSLLLLWFNAKKGGGFLGFFGFAARATGPRGACVRRCERTVAVANTDARLNGRA